MCPQRVARLAVLITKANEMSDGGSVLKKAIYLSGEKETDELRDCILRVARLLGYPVKIRKHVAYENGMALWTTDGN